MIQRIQTVWLFLAALMGAGLFMFDLYVADVMINNEVQGEHLNALNHYGLLLLAVIVTALPLIAIFMFKNRKRQKSLTILSIVANIGFIAFMVMLANNLANDMNETGEGGYRLGAVLPVIAVILLVMAWRGINKDQKLIKSLDRLR